MRMACLVRHTLAAVPKVTQQALACSQSVEPRPKIKRQPDRRGANKREKKVEEHFLFHLASQLFPPSSFNWQYKCTCHCGASQKWVVAPVETPERKSWLEEHKPRVNCFTASQISFSLNKLCSYMQLFYSVWVMASTWWCFWCLLMMSSYYWWPVMPDLFSIIN